jgi:hypothetical protein
MPWESIGSTNTGEMPGDESWILWSLEVALQYVSLVCGEPTGGTRLKIMWHEHDLGTYPSLGVYYEGDPPWDYINRCEAALTTLNNSVSWYDLKVHIDTHQDKEEVSEGR